ncbi:hypothetical protein AVEN_126158-1 [Araneus ventricosus]|uniref:Uncharacterized protein n=1 Tax=Araneus ventricosus TaxID=182803 RepID=A0A4Y2FRD6_ARAVE|nr:hypothetical protein AVEN_126158-1 [Araneus ventricosus]
MLICSFEVAPDWLQKSTFTSPASRLPIGSPPTSSIDQTKISETFPLMNILSHSCCKLLSTVVSGSDEPQAPRRISFVRYNTQQQIQSFVLVYCWP